jgi:predicted phage terminase large subunit-like protein
MQTVIQNEINVPRNFENSINCFLARNYLIDFIGETFKQYSPQWYHELICKKCDDFYSGKIKKLMIFVPPQHGKSEIVTRRLPAYALGKNPKLKIAVVSYASDKASKFNREIQRIIDDEKYKELFPDTFLNNSNVVSNSHGAWLRNSTEFETVGHGGSCKCVGVGGPLTGDPVDIGIIDDPIKDYMDAYSPTVRETVWNWYISVFKNRLHNESRQLIMLTRWHEDDLPGRLLAIEDDWEVISIPRIKENDDNPNDPRKIGEVLWEKKHSLASANESKKLSPRLFASMQQQHPSPAEGNIFQESWFRYYDEPPIRCDEIIISMDCAFKDQSHNDYVAATAWCKVGVESYLLDCIRGHWGFVDTIKQFKMFNEKWQPQSKYIEDKANGTAIIEVLKSQIPGIIAINPTESKVARAEAVSFVFEAGNILFPRNAEWLEDYKAELKGFPNSKHNDMVDSTTQALNRLYKNNKTFFGRV